MFVTRSDGETIKKIKCLLASKFEMKDIGVADVILGVKIHKTSGGLALSQSHYIETIFGKSKNLGIVSVKTPIDVNLHLSKNTGENKAQNEYASILGSLMYVMNCTRPDIACAVSKLSRFTVSPNENHWKAMKRLLGYLKHTQDYALHYTEYPAVLEGYCDANWITGTKDTKSTSGYVFTLGGEAVSWKSSKQLVLLDPLWNQNLLLWIKPVKKPSGFEISWKIFLIGLNQCPLYVYIVIVKRQ